MHRSAKRSDTRAVTRKKTQDAAVTIKPAQRLPNLATGAVALQFGAWNHDSF
jgi:hypothetical protein